MRTIKAQIAIVAAVMIAALGAAGAQAAAGPKLVQVSYDESYDGSFPTLSLQAYAYRVDALRFTTRYSGERATGEAKYIDHITDTNIHEQGEARHPWQLIRRNDGKQVTNLIDRSLDERGFAKVRIRARGNGRHLDEAVEIRLSECSQDPPIYPVSCEVRP